MDANVATLIANLSNNEADTTETARIYVDVLNNLANVPILAQFVATIAPVNGNVPFPNNGVSLLLAFFNNIQIGELSIREADWLLPNWRGTTGTPYNYVRESFGVYDIQLVPQPVGGNAQLITSYTTDTLPVWLQMPVALLVLADEYSRESDHQNIPLGAACKQLGELLLAILVE